MKAISTECRPPREQKVLRQVQGPHFSWRMVMMVSLVAILPSAVFSNEDEPPTSFAYQGTLQDGEGQIDGHFDMSFDLFDAEVGGNWLGRIDRTSIAVSAGNFSTDLDFGTKAVAEEGLWLELHLRSEDDASYTKLEPRQNLGRGSSSACTVEGDLLVNGTITADPVGATTGLSVTCCNEASLAGGGQIQLFGFLGGLSIDSNEIQARTLLQGGNFFLNPHGGNVGVGHANAEAPLHLPGSPDASPTSGGALVIGQVNASNIAIDSNEIMARNNGQASTLLLNREGGDVSVGGTLRIGYTVVIETRQASPGRGFVLLIDAVCPANTKVLGGGCVGEDTEQSYPHSNGSAWRCLGATSARAICAQIN